MKNSIHRAFSRLTSYTSFSPLRKKSLINKENTPPMKTLNLVSKFNSDREFQSRNQTEKFSNFDLPKSFRNYDLEIKEKNVKLENLKKNNLTKKELFRIIKMKDEENKVLKTKISQLLKENEKLQKINALKFPNSYLNKKIIEDDDIITDECKVQDSNQRFLNKEKIIDFTLQSQNFLEYSFDENSFCLFNSEFLKGNYSWELTKLNNFGVLFVNISFTFSSHLKITNHQLFIDNYEDTGKVY